jgi:hypothetical protein
MLVGKGDFLGSAYWLVQRGTGFTVLLYEDDISTFFTKFCISCSKQSSLMTIL